MTDIIMIPLSKLVESEDNVRRAYAKDSVASLAQSIRALGLLQSLVVRENGKGRFAVVAGGRRLRALRLLAKAGEPAKTAPIPCRVMTSDEDAATFSLAENVVRHDLLPWEELQAYGGLIDSGEGPETIAARFGVSPQHVARRLKLARVSPRLIEALKSNEASLDQLAALAVIDDHAAQERAFFDAPDWARTPERLRAEVCQDHVTETDKLALFVGVDAYLGAGGAIVSDLFADTGDDASRYLADRDLITRLATSKLEPLAALVRAEGWAWVETAIDGVAWTQFPERVRERRRELTEAERAEQERLLTQLDETEEETEIETIEAALDALAAPAWDPDEVALAGAIITLTTKGESKIERGLVKAEDAKALKALRRKRAKLEADASSEAIKPQPRERPRLPAKLVDELLAHKTLALRVELASRPDLALRLVVFTLALPLVGTSSASCLALSIAERDMGPSITRSDSSAPAAYEDIADAWRTRLPADPEALWAFVALADTTTLLELMAAAIAPGVDLRIGPYAVQARLAINAAIVEAAHLDMSKYWSATPASFFDHVRKDVLIDAIKEEKPSLDRALLEKCAKSELIARAKRVFKSSAWLPEPLRPGASQSTPVAIAAE